MRVFGIRFTDNPLQDAPKSSLASQNMVALTLRLVYRVAQPDHDHQRDVMIRFIFLVAYRLAWVPLLPVLLIYLFKRGRRDALYAQHIGERFAIYSRPLPQNAIWVHAVSLGEIRSAIALIRLMLARGDTVIITNFTPAGRREALRQFADEIAAGQLAVVWVPFDMMWTYRRFLRASKPKIGLTLEVEVWPAMIDSAKRAGVPLYMCNGQYGSRPLARDSRGLRIRQRIMRGLTGVMVKSNLQAERFVDVGLDNVVVTGELRFDQPIPPHLTDAGDALRPELSNKWSEVVAIASGVDAEEDIYIALIKDVRANAAAAGKRPPLFVYVPRAPERFDPLAQKLETAGLVTRRRSQCLTAELAIDGAVFTEETAILMGDSLGEMFFYLSLADRVIVGGGYTPHGAHNIIEPLSLGKPVLTGPVVWPIEYPFVEAEAAGVAIIAQDRHALAQMLAQPQATLSAQIDAFLQEHSGASQRTLDAIDAVLSGRP